MSGARTHNEETGRLLHEHIVGPQGQGGDLLPVDGDLSALLQVDGGAGHADGDRPGTRGELGHERRGEIHCLQKKKFTQISFAWYRLLDKSGIQVFYGSNSGIVVVSGKEGLAWN